MIRKPIIFMFSGQGSHYYQMGRELFEQQPLFRQWLQAGDMICQSMTGLSIINTLYNDNYKKTEPFTRTLLTHPAIFIVEHGLGQLLLAQGIRPDYVLGASLGEFAAAVFAGNLSFETALTAVIKQAQILEEKCLSGSMLAILASSELYHNHDFLQKKSELAASSFHSHFTVSGHPDDLTAVETYLAAQSINFQRLAVSHAFHSSHIDDAAADYQHFINQQSLGISTTPFISCAQAKQLNVFPLTHFWDIIRLPIQFKITVENLEKAGEYYYVDIGPSGTLAAFVKYNLIASSASQPLTLMSPFGQDAKNLEHIMEYLTL